VDASNPPGSSNTSEERGREPEAVDAAGRVGTRFGYTVEKPVLIQETNNSVVWLIPHAVIAKVGKWPHSEASLIKEHAVASALTAVGAPVASPIAGIDPTHDRATGFIVTLWERLETADRPRATPEEIAGSLRQLHSALRHYGGELPTFETSLDLAEAALWDDDVMHALSPDDRTMLRRTFERGRAQVSAHGYREQRIHGEPHEGNLLLTERGLRWVDLEETSVGPVEWDLAFLPADVGSHFPEADAELLAILRTLNSAVVATWCFARSEFADMRRHGEHHLKRVRDASGGA
jgi:aminoglycoside phosphotransferase (APT) family kinase protein